MSHSAAVTATFVHRGYCWRIGKLAPSVLTLQADERGPLPRSGLFVIVVDREVYCKRISVYGRRFDGCFVYREVE